MTNNDGFVSRGLHAKEPSSLDALMATLFTGAGITGYNLVNHMKSITGDYDTGLILVLGIPLAVGVGVYTAIRYFVATETPSNNGNRDKPRFLESNPNTQSYEPDMHDYRPIDI